MSNCLYHKGVWVAQAQIRILHEPGANSSLIVREFGLITNLENQSSEDLANRMGGSGLQHCHVSGVVFCVCS